MNTQDHNNTSRVGFDLGGSKMLAVVFDGASKPLGRHRRKTRAHEGVDAGVARIIETIYDAIADASLKSGQIAGIGLACPGPLDLDRGILVDAPNLGWSNVHLKDELEKEFGCPTTIMNDVDAGTYGEYTSGAGRDGRCVLGVFPGTGIGGGCVYEGKVLRGHKSSSMEIGHVTVISEGPRCGCGGRGCLEAVASRLAIAAAAASEAHRGNAPHLLRNAGTDISAIRSGALARSVAGGDVAVEQIVRQAARYIGFAVASVVHLLAPDIVVLGGGLVEAMPELFVEEVREAAHQRIMPSYVDSFQVVAAELGDDAAVVGAAAGSRDGTFVKA